MRDFIEISDNYWVSPHHIVSVHGTGPVPIVRVCTGDKLTASKYKGHVERLMIDIASATNGHNVLTDYHHH